MIIFHHSARLDELEEKQCSMFQMIISEYFDVDQILQNVLWAHILLQNIGTCVCSMVVNTIF